MRLMTDKPTILHITSHGDYDFNKREYALLFENDRGCLEMLGEARLKEIMQEFTNHNIKLVFVSACHSQKIGEIFFNAGIPVVISVNSLTPILDEVCQKYAK